MKRVVLIVIGCLSIAAVAASCKSGEGDRCQVTADCEEPLVCNKAKNTCQSSSGGDLDASVPDAPTDAPVDTP